MTIVSTTSSFGAEWGRSNWDKRPHHPHHRVLPDFGRDHHDDNDHHHGGGDADAKTETPIKHVIVLIGENRGLDHTFGVYRPKGKGQTISNLLSKGIVNEDGSP